jgi:putative transposase
LEAGFLVSFFMVVECSFGESLIWVIVFSTKTSAAFTDWGYTQVLTLTLISEALTMAWFRRRPHPGLIVHSDRGSQYCSANYQAKLKSYGMVSSMSRKGNCWDSAPAESWFGSFKNEAIYGNRFANHELMRTTCFDYIEVRYNRKRLHSSLGYQSPKQYLQNWLAKRKDILVA